MAIVNQSIVYGLLIAALILVASLVMDVRRLWREHETKEATVHTFHGDR
jgi:hypothetical protein